MFAYVQFVRDKVKVIVPQEDIKDFKPRDKADFLPSVPYLVRWRGKTVDQQGRVGASSSYHRAYILRMDETKEDLTSSIQQKRPRVPTRKADHEESTAEETDFELDESSSSNQESQDIDSLLHEHRASLTKKRNILADQEDSGAGCSSQDQDFVSSDPVEETGSTDARYKAKCKRLRAERDVLKEENEAYRKLNLDLQRKIQDLEKGGRRTSLDEEAMAPPPRASPFRADVVAAIHGLNTESRVVKALAVATWGSEELGKRSVLGQKANKTGGGGRAPLTPEKVERIRSEVTSYMDKRGKSADYQRVVHGQINKFINEKIQDLRRKKTREQHPRVLAPETEVNMVEESE